MKLFLLTLLAFGFALAGLALGRLRGRLPRAGGGCGACDTGPVRPGLPPGKSVPRDRARKLC